MPIGTLISAGVLFLLVVVALRPPRAPGRLGVIAYLAGGMVVTELPLLWALLGTANTASALDAGKLESPVGMVALILDLVALAGLGLVAYRGSRSRAAMESALGRALGPDWRTAIRPALARRLDTRSHVASGLLLPFLRRRRSVEHTAGHSYGDAGKRNLLDVYRHRSRPTGSPVFVHFHGGHFRSGGKNRESLPLLYQLASHGWCCVSATYRLSPRAGFPDYVVDAKRVLAWVREHADEIGADPDLVFVGGNSAGGYLAAFAALTPGDERFQPGFEDADTSVTAAICQYGYYGRTDGRDPDSTPAAFVGPQAPPFLLVHGDRDSVVPVAWGRRFAARLRAESGQPVVWCELPGAQHSFDYFASVRARVVADRIEAFAAWVRSRTPHPVA